MTTTVYKTHTCTLCPQLESFMKAHGIQYQTVYVDTAEGLAEMRTEGIFSLSVPVLQVGNATYLPATMFKGGVLDETGLRLILGV